MALRIVLDWLPETREGKRCWHPGCKVLDCVRAVREKWFCSEEHRP